MRKRGFWLINFLFFVLSSFTVYAQEEGLLDVFQDMGKFLFHDLPMLGDYGFKFLLWICVFALFQWGLSKIPHMEKKIAGIISFVLSLASVLLMPSGLVENLFRTYAVIVVFILGVFVPLLLVWVVHKSFQEDTLADHMIKAVTYFVIAYALFTFTKYVEISQLAGTT
jgi:hypothetical protein